MGGFSMDKIAAGLILWLTAYGRKRSYSSNHCFSQLIFCGECNEMFRRRPVSAKPNDYTSV